MLRKLIKYDIKDAFNKVIVIYATLSLIFSLMTRGLMLIENSVFWSIVARILLGTSISMIVGLIINALIHSWVNFSSGFYGDKSYLTHTLPVTKTTLYNSKFVSSFLCMLIGVCVAGISLFIIFYSKENAEILKSILLPLADAYDTSVIWMAFVLLAELFLQMLSLIQAGYIGIILGHRCQNSKTGMSFLFGGIAYALTQLIILAVLLLIALGYPGLMQLFISKEMTDITVFKNIMYILIGLYTLILTVGYILGTKLLNKGVNVD